MVIRFYGSLGERIGREIGFDLAVGREGAGGAGGCTIGQLRERLAIAFPESAAELSRSSSRACVGDVLVAEDFRVDGSAAVEFLPPLSGG